jgi:signal transduction histidine kinase
MVSRIFPWRRKGALGDGPYPECGPADAPAVRAAAAISDSRAAALREAETLESLSRFAGAVAHDFNNFLTLINGHCDLLLSRLDDDDAALRRVKQIRSAGAGAANFVQQLLTIAGREIADPRLVRLNQVVHEAAPLIRPMLWAGIALELSCAATPDWIVADPGQLRRALLELAVRARDVMPDGGVIAIHTANREDSGRQSLLLTVADSGPSIDAETLPRLFEPFLPVVRPGSRPGFGLATVHGILRQNGADVQAESGPGGTRFRILFPAAAESIEKLTYAAPDGRGSNLLP